MIDFKKVKPQERLDATERYGKQDDGKLQDAAMETEEEAKQGGGKTFVPGQVPTKVPTKEQKRKILEAIKVLIFATVATRFCQCALDLVCWPSVWLLSLYFAILLKEEELIFFVLFCFANEECKLPRGDGPVGGDATLRQGARQFWKVRVVKGSAEFAFRIW